MKRSGFTMIELMIVSLLLLTTVTAIYTTLHFHSRNTRELINLGKLHYLEEVTLKEMERTSRPASALIGPGENYNGIPMSLPGIAVDTFYAVDVTGSIIGGYGVGNGRLYELDNGSWVPFVSGNDTIDLLAGSQFQLSTDRKEVSISLGLMVLDRSDTILVPRRGGLIRCRN